MKFKLPNLDAYLIENFTDGSYLAKKEIENLSESTKINTVEKSIQDALQYMQDKLHASKFSEEVSKSEGDIKNLPDHGFDKLILPVMSIISTKIKEYPQADVVTFQIVNTAVDNLIKNASAFKNCYSQGVTGANGTYGALGRYLYETMVLSVIGILIEYVVKIVAISTDSNGKVSVALRNKKDISLEKKFIVQNLKKINSMIISGDLAFILSPDNYIGNLSKKAKKFDALSSIEESTVTETKQELIDAYLSEAFVFGVAAVSIVIFSLIVLLRLAVYYFYTIRESLANGLRELAYFVELNTLMSSGKSQSKDSQLEIVKKMKQYATSIEVDVNEAEKGIVTQSKAKNDFITAAKSTEIEKSGVMF